MLSPWLTAIVSAITGTTIGAGTATGVGLGIAGGVLAGAGLGALGSGIQSAVSDSPFNWKGVGIGAGLGGVTAGLGSALGSSASPAVQAASKAVEGTALEGAGTVASQVGGPGVGTFLDAGVKVGQGALDTLQSLNQSFGPSAFVDALESTGAVGQFAADTGKGLVKGAAFGALQNPKDPLKGAAMGAAGGAIGGFAGGATRQLPMRTAIETMAVPDIPGASMSPSVQPPLLPGPGAYDPTAMPSGLAFQRPLPTLDQAGMQYGAGLAGKMGSGLASQATGMALTNPPTQPEQDPLMNPGAPFPDYRRLYSRGGGFGY